MTSLNGRAVFGTCQGNPLISIDLKSLARGNLIQVVTGSELINQKIEIR